MPCRRASCETTNRPMRPSCRRLATLTWSGSVSRAFILFCSPRGMPRPRSSTSTASPEVTRLARSSTWVCGAENTVAFSTSSASRWMTSATACPRRVPSIGGTSFTREYCSTSAIADRSTSVMETGLLHWRRETAPPRTARFSAWRRMRVARWSTWKRPLSRSGSSISFSSSSRIEISRCTRDCSRRARLTKTSSFCSLPAWLESCAACTTAATAPSWARERSAASSSKSSASAGLATCLARGRVLAPAQPYDEGAQVGLRPRTGAPQGAQALPYGLGGTVGGHGGDQDAGQGHAHGACEYGPQDGAGAGAGGADGEQYGRARAEGHRDRWQDRQAQQLGPQMGLGQRGGGMGARSPVPPALTAVCACGRCAKVRHRCPRTVASEARGLQRVGATRACAIAVPVERAEKFGPASPDGN